MKTLGKAIAVVSLAVASTVQAGTSITGGVVSDYYFRGMNLGDAGAYASLDWESDFGLTVGTWIIDDGGTSCDDTTVGDCANGNDGLETDFYISYGGEAGSFSYGVAYNRYQYTYTSDYEHEVVLSFGLAGFGAELAEGQDIDREGTSLSDDEADYSVYTLSYSDDNWGVLVGEMHTHQGDEMVNLGGRYNWAEVSATTEVATIGVTLTVGKVFNAESDTVGGAVDASSVGDEYIVLDLSKSFDL